MQKVSKIEKLLKVGDLRSAGNSEKVVSMVLSQPGLFSDVVRSILSEHEGARMRASDAVEKITRLHPEYLQAHKKLFLQKISKIDQKEVKWHNAQILPRLRLTKKERREVFMLMLSYLEDKSSIVKTFAMQALCDIALQEKSYLDQVKEIVTQALKTGTPAMQSRAKKLATLLEQEI